MHLQDHFTSDITVLVVKRKRCDSLVDCIEVKSKKSKKSACFERISEISDDDANAYNSILVSSNTRDKIRSNFNLKDDTNVVYISAQRVIHDSKQDNCDLQHVYDYYSMMEVDELKVDEMETDYWDFVDSDKFKMLDCPVIVDQSRFDFSGIQHVLKDIEEEDESDENSESNWRNDYPVSDLSSDFRKGSDSENSDSLSDRDSVLEYGFL